MSAVPPTPTPPLCMLAYPHTGRDGKENHGNGPFPLDDGLGDGLLAAIDGECMHILKITRTTTYSTKASRDLRARIQNLETFSASGIRS